MKEVTKVEKMSLFDSNDHSDSKEELIVRLKNLLKEKGCYSEIYDPFNLNFEFTEDLLNMIKLGCSEDHVRDMIHLLDTSDTVDSAGFYNYCKRHGLLKIEPKIISTPGEIPSLMLDIDRYLHWFRGYHFQISDTHQGIGEVYSGTYRLDRALDSIKYLPEDSIEDAKRDVFTASFIPILFYDDVGYKLGSKTEILDKFLELSGKLSRVEKPSMTNFMSKLIYEKFPFKPELIPQSHDGKQNMHIRISCNGICYALLRLSGSAVCLVTASGTIHTCTTLCLPEWLFMKDEFGDNYVAEPEKIICLLVNALFAVCRFHADYMALYPTGGERGDFQPLNYNVPMITESWQDIEDAILQYYKYVVGGEILWDTIC